MGFGMKELKASAADSAAFGEKLVNRLEKDESAEKPSDQSLQSRQQADLPVRPSRFSPTSSPSTFAPVQQEATSVAVSQHVVAEAVSTEKSFQRPSFGQSTASAAPNVVRRPSFGGSSEPSDQDDAPRQQSTAQPSSAGRPSFGHSSPSQSSRPVAQQASTSPSPSQERSGSLPDLRGVFTRDQKKPFTKPNQSQSSSPVGGLSEQELFELVCTHRKMSPTSIDAARAQWEKDPERVERQMRHVYETEVAPNHLQTASNLQHALEQNPDKVVFLLRKDGKESCRRVELDRAKETGQILLQGSTLESVQASATPFGPPSQLFPPSIEQIAEQASEQHVAVEQPMDPKPEQSVQRSLKL